MHTNHLPGAPGGDDDAQFNIEPTPQEAAALATKDDEGGGKTEAELEAERAEQERAEREQQEQERQRQVDEAARIAEAAKAQHPGDPPAPPEDFAAARSKADTDMRNGLLDPVDYQQELDRIREGRAEFDRVLAEHAASVTKYEATQQQIAEAKKAGEDAWVADYSAFVKDNAEFMGNPLYVRDMQTVIDDILQKDPRIDNTKLLADAYKRVSEYHKYEKPAPSDDALRDALKNRLPESPGLNLGDAPTARSESITGNETFDALDRLQIDQLEDVVAGMSGQQLERYLASAPGANATGRD